MTTIFIDTNILYHILHKTSRTDEALDLLEENPGDYVIDMIVHNEIIYTSTMHYLERKYSIRGAYSAREWIKKYGYPVEIVNAIRDLLNKLNIKILSNIYTEPELYDALVHFRLLPSDAIIALTCRHYGINTILTFDEDFKRVPWLNVIP